MNTNTITGYLIDVANEQARPVTVEHSLESFYKLLDCDMIEIAPRRIGFPHHNRTTKIYDIICDEEGLLKDSPKISAIDNIGSPMLVGNLLIVNMGEEDVESLTPDDIAYIEKYVELQATRKYPTPYPMLMQCEYAY